VSLQTSLRALTAIAPRPNYGTEPRPERCGRRGVGHQPQGVMATSVQRYNSRQPGLNCPFQGGHRRLDIEDMVRRIQVSVGFAVEEPASEIARLPADNRG
jgi:hypothetical protein